MSASAASYYERDPDFYYEPEDATPANTGWMERMVRPQNRIITLMPSLSNRTRQYIATERPQLSLVPMPDAPEPETCADAEIAVILLLLEAIRPIEPVCTDVMRQCDVSRLAGSRSAVYTAERALRALRLLIDRKLRAGTPPRLFEFE